MTSEDGAPVALVVEDEKYDAAKITGALERHGAVVHVVDRLYEAESFLEEAARHGRPIRLVVLDWKLAGGGLAVLRAIRMSANLGRTPVIVFSGSDAQRDIADAYEGGANAYITKAGDLDELEWQLDLIAQVWLRAVQPAPIGPVILAAPRAG
jgi:DNA-binding response OmpR family regulator